MPWTFCQFSCRFSCLQLASLLLVFLPFCNFNCRSLCLVVFWVSRDSHSYYHSCRLSAFHVYFCCSVCGLLVIAVSISLSYVSVCSYVLLSFASSLSFTSLLSLEHSSFFNVFSSLISNSCLHDYLVVSQFAIAYCFLVVFLLIVVFICLLLYCRPF